MRFLRLLFKRVSLTDNIDIARATLLMVCSTGSRILLHSDKEEAMKTNSKLTVAYSLGLLTLLSGGRTNLSVASGLWA